MFNISPVVFIKKAHTNGFIPELTEIIFHIIYWQDEYDSH